MIGERVLYNRMRKCHISTLDVHRVLQEIGIDICKRSVQNYLDSDMATCTDDRVKKVIIKMIRTHEKMVKNLKKEVK